MLIQILESSKIDLSPGFISEKGMKPAKRKGIGLQFYLIFPCLSRALPGWRKIPKSYYKCLPYKKSKNKSLARKHIECYKRILIRVRTLLEIIQAMTKMHLLLHSKKCRARSKTDRQRDNLYL